MNGAIIVFFLILLVLVIVLVMNSTKTSSMSLFNFTKPVSSPETGAILPHSQPSATVVKDKHGAKSLVLSCIDYRFVTQTVEFLNKERLGDFDQFVLAGAALGYNESVEKHSTKEIPKHASVAWHLAYEDHVRLAIKLHHITEIIVVGHSTCGYFSSVYGEAVNTPEKEKRKQEFNMHKFVRLMKSKDEFKDLTYLLLYAELQSDGKVTFTEIDN